MGRRLGWQPTAPAAKLTWARLLASQGRSRQGKRSIGAPGAARSLPRQGGRRGWSWAAQGRTCFEGRLPSDALAIDTIDRRIDTRSI
jgi:hypothetical protein